MPDTPPGKQSDAAGCLVGLAVITLLEIPFKFWIMPAGMGLPDWSVWVSVGIAAALLSAAFIVKK